MKMELEETVPKAERAVMPLGEGSAAVQVMALASVAEVQAKVKAMLAAPEAVVASAPARRWPVVGALGWGDGKCVSDVDVSEPNDPRGTAAAAAAARWVAGVRARMHGILEVLEALDMLESLTEELSRVVAVESTTEGSLRRGRGVGLVGIGLNPSDG